MNGSDIWNAVVGSGFLIGALTIWLNFRTKKNQNEIDWYDRAINEIERLEKRLATILDQVNEYEIKLNEAENIIEKQEEELKSKETLLQEQEDRHQELKRTIEELKSIIEDLQKELKDYSERVEKENGK